MLYDVTHLTPRCDATQRGTAWHDMAWHQTVILMAGHVARGSHCEHLLAGGARRFLQGGYNSFDGKKLLSLAECSVFSNPAY